MLRCCVKNTYLQWKKYWNQDIIRIGAIQNDVVNFFQQVYISIYTNASWWFGCASFVGRSSKTNLDSIRWRKNEIERLFESVQFKIRTRNFTSDWILNTIASILNSSQWIQVDIMQIFIKAYYVFISRWTPDIAKYAEQ